MEQPVYRMNFAFCDTSPWDVKKAAAANISLDMVSYISYLLYPFPSTAAIPNEAQLEQEYLTLLAEYDNNTEDVLGAVTRDFDSYVVYCSFCREPFTPQYVMQKKCFRSPENFVSPVPLLFSKLGLGMTLRSGSINRPRLNCSIASPKACMGGMIDLVVYEPNSAIESFDEVAFKPLMWNYTNSLPVEVEIQNMEKGSH